MQTIQYQTVPLSIQEQQAVNDWFLKTARNFNDIATLVDQFAGLLEQKNHSANAHEYSAWCVAS